MQSLNYIVHTNHFNENTKKVVKNIPANTYSTITNALNALYTDLKALTEREQWSSVLSCAYGDFHLACITGNNTYYHYNGSYISSSGILNLDLAIGKDNGSIARYSLVLSSNRCDIGNAGSTAQTSGVTLYKNCF